MDDAALAKWLREEWPRVRRAMDDYQRAAYSTGDFSEAVDALTALLALLADIETAITSANSWSDISAIQARLRAIGVAHE